MNDSQTPRDSSALSGKRILVTRARTQAGELSAQLSECGAEPVIVPLIEFRSIANQATAELIRSKLSEAKWIVFTSSNAIRFFFELLDAKLPDTVRIACVGPRTRQTLQKFGCDADLVPDRFSSLGLADEIQINDGDQILYPSPKETNPELVQSLQTAGGIVSQVVVYETFQVKLSSTELGTLRSNIDAVTFTSPSVVSSFCDQISDHQAVLSDTVVACIGPLTAARASELGVGVDVMPEQHTGQAMVDALVEYFEDNRE